MATHLYPLINSNINKTSVSSDNISIKLVHMSYEFICRLIHLAEKLICVFINHLRFLKYLFIGINELLSLFTTS